MGQDRGNKEVGSTFRASDNDLCLFYVARRTGQSVGGMTTHVGGILGCGESRIMGKVRAYLTKRPGVMQIQVAAPTQVGFEIAQLMYSAIEITQKVPTDGSQLLPAFSELLDQRQRALEPGWVSSRRCKLGELRRPSTAPRPDICARAAVKSA